MELKKNKELLVAEMALGRMRRDLAMDEDNVRQDLWLREHLSQTSHLHLSHLSQTGGQTGSMSVGHEHRIATAASDRYGGSGTCGSGLTSQSCSSKLLLIPPPQVGDTCTRTEPVP